MSTEQVEAGMLMVVSKQRDTKTAPVALRQGKLKRQVWNPAWRKEMVGWTRPQHTANDGGL